MQKVDPFEIRWQDAREALSAIGFVPLTTLGQAEHWIRAERHATLYVENIESATDSINLKDARHVYFAKNRRGELTAHV